MADFPTSITKDFIIPSNSEIEISIAGNFIRCLSSTAPFKLAAGDANSYVDISQGFACEAEDGYKFETVRLKNETGAAITATLFIGFGKFHDSRLTLTGGVLINSSMAAPVFVKQTGSTFVAGADITITAGGNYTGGGNTANRAQMYKNLISNAGPVRIGTGANATTGIELMPGETIVLELTGNCIIHNPNASSVIISNSFLRD